MERKIKKKKLNKENTNTWSTQHKHRSFTKQSHKFRSPQQQVTDNDNEKGTKLVTFCCLNSTHSTFTKEKLNTQNTQYIHYTIAILESAKPLLLNKETTFTFKQSDEKQRAKI